MIYITHKVFGRRAGEGSKSRIKFCPSACADPVPWAAPSQLFGSLGLSFHAYLFLSTVELQQKDRALVELLQEKVGLFAEMTHFQADEDSVSGMPLPALPRGLFRSESLESPRGERLLRDAIREGEGSPSEVARLSLRTGPSQPHNP